jgi:predicted RNase H-related nuclease YkuK (DUF458 family)
MKKIFKNVKGERIDEIQHCFDTIKQNPNCKIYVGTDSQNKRRFSIFATVIAFRYGTRGAHFIYTKESIKPKLKNVEVRLTQEVYKTMELVQQMLDNDIPIYAVDFDFNDDKKFQSNALVNMSTGWARGLGLRANVKPDELISSKAADWLVRS